MKDVGAFDMAACNTQFRATYLNHLAGKNTWHIGDDIESLKYLKWLHARKTYISRCFLKVGAKSNDFSKASWDKSNLEFSYLYMYKSALKECTHLKVQLNDMSLRDADCKVAAIIEAIGSNLRHADISFWSDFANPTFCKPSEVTDKALVEHAVNLKTLSISHTLNNGVLMKLPHLREVCIDRVSVDGTAFITALQASTISKLKLTHSSFNPGDLVLTQAEVNEGSWSPGMNALEDLVIEECDFHVGFVNDCVRTRNGLRRFVFNSCIGHGEPLMTENTARAISQWSPGLKILKTRACGIEPNFTVAGFEELLKLSELEHMDIAGPSFQMQSGNYERAVDAFAKYIGANSCLTHLSLSFCEMNTSLMYRAISSHSLKSITLRTAIATGRQFMGVEFSDENICDIATNCPNLEVIALNDSAENRDSSSIGDRSIEAIAYHCRYLKSLSLVGGLFSKQSIWFLMTTIPRRANPLEKLEITNGKHDKFKKEKSVFLKAQNAYFNYHNSAKKVKDTRAEVLTLSS